MVTWALAVVVTLLVDGMILVTVVLVMIVEVEVAGRCAGIERNIEPRDGRFNFL